MLETLSETHPYTLRPATLEDADLIASLIRRAWAGTVAPESQGHRMGGAKVLSRLEYGGGAFILEHLGDPVGCVQFVPLEDDVYIWEIMGAAVLREHRGNRLVDRMLEMVEVAARRARVSELRLAVRQDNTTHKLVSLYERNGFVVDKSLEYSQRNPLTVPPVVLRKVLN